MGGGGACTSAPGPGLIGSPGMMCVTWWCAYVLLLWGPERLAAPGPNGSSIWPWELILIFTSYTNLIVDGSAFLELAHSARAYLQVEFSPMCTRSHEERHRDKLKTALDYLLFNSFVRFGPHVFKQIKGIPMGGNASPLIADLFLANLEFKYMDKLVSSKSPENLRMAKKLSNNSRYIDDIGVCNMNNNNEFMICSKDIYPESIPLTTGCIENDKDTFLDLDITLVENRFITKIYNKVDDFDFEVVSFPFPTSNMSDHITYNSFYSQLVRFSSVCSKFNDFDIRSRNLLESLLNRGFSKYRLKNSFSKFALNHHDVLDIKYSMEEINEFIRSHFS